MYWCTTGTTPQSLRTCGATLSKVLGLRECDCHDASLVAGFVDVGFSRHTKPMKPVHSQDVLDGGLCPAGCAKVREGSPWLWEILTSAIYTAFPLPRATTDRPQRASDPAGQLRHHWSSLSHCRMMAASSSLEGESLPIAAERPADQLCCPKEPRRPRRASGRVFIGAMSVAFLKPCGVGLPLG